MLHMKHILFLVMFTGSLISATSLFANKSSVEITAPDSAVKGSEITIKIQVSHNGNSRFHHTEWAYIKVNGQEVARWKYPFESEVFTCEIKYKVIGPVEIQSEASCNLHGSAGIKTAKVNVK